MSDPALLADLPDRVADAIRAALPGLREVAAHAGRFDLDELKAFTARAPAVRVALLRVDKGVEVGSALVYAAIHQLSGAGTKRPNIPARPYLGVSDQDEQDLADAVETFWTRSLGGVA